jgi:hypothetical protein
LLAVLMDFCSGSPTQNHSGVDNGEPLHDELDAVRKPNGSDDHMPSVSRH